MKHRTRDAVADLERHRWKCLRTSGHRGDIGEVGLAVEKIFGQRVGARSCYVERWRSRRCSGGVGGRGGVQEHVGGAEGQENGGWCLCGIAGEGPSGGRRGAVPVTDWFGLNACPLRIPSEFAIPSGSNSPLGQCFVRIWL